MERAEDAWRRVGEQFAALGEHLRRHYARSAEGSPGRDTEEAVRRTLDDLADAAERLASTTGDSLRDPQVRDEARRAAASLLDALGATFTDLGDGLRRRARTDGPPPGAGDPGRAGGTDPQRPGD